MGPPAGILLQKNAPTVTAGATLSVDGDPVGLSGDYYVATSATKVHFDGTSVDLGAVDLALAK